MVNSSPEYSITKPGLHHLRKRDKPLRTYGRQPSIPEAQSEPPLKRRRVSTVKQQQQQQDEEAEEEEVTAIPERSKDVPGAEATPTEPSPETKTTQDTPNEIKPDTKRAASSKGSILSYFKPAQAPSKATKDETQPPSQESQSQPEDEPSSSPPKRKQPTRRKPRLLKFKSLTHESPDESSSQDQDESPHTSDETTPQFRRPLKTTTPNALSSEPLSTSTFSTPPSLSPRKTSLRNHQKARPSKPSSSSSSSPSIQTTLNISSKAAFSECKICDTVWNPLYPDDVKFHNKTHKAVLRAQKKRKMDEL
ncbi:hypothetical protein A9Z42_0080750 [Trichoderma parareesei]|uniref:N-acetyltransferase ESCO zinc-finger domain-containing protein n=1 Tax=Trichoderma parareesei TaxID=858221 RepID=A0A2H3A5D6_TRIPA|nr:hypothetical protein A9Z42_0080750 [Trichoderma parareesei]